MRSPLGQASVEYVGLVALLALALAALATVAEAPASPGLSERLGGAILPEPSLVSATREPAPRPALSVVERLMGGNLEAFLAYRDSAARDPRLDYSTDECTAPIVGSRGPSFDFTEACLRHDFGYRNYGRLGVLDERREEVDDRFLRDMQAHCAARPSSQMIACFTWAGDFHRAVRAFGWLPASRYR
jgi:hypothetical protein